MFFLFQKVFLGPEVTLPDEGDAAGDCPHPGGTDQGGQGPPRHRGLPAHQRPQRLWERDQGIRRDLEGRKGSRGDLLRNMGDLLGDTRDLGGVWAIS